MHIEIGFDNVKQSENIIAKKWKIPKFRQSHGILPDYVI